MKKSLKCLISVLLICSMLLGGSPFIVSSEAASNNIAPSKPTGLLMDLMEEPFGISNPNPAMSWIVNDTDKNEMQTAYQILVASSLANINADNGDVWDSGKVTSSDSSNVPYVGSELAANTAYYWKVRTWDKSGEVGPYSEPQRFSTAIDTWTGKALWDGKTDVDAYSLYERMGWKNYDIECKFLIKESALGFCFYMDNAETNCYMWQISAKNGTIKPHYFENSKATAKPTTPITVNVNTEYTMKLSIRDMVVTMYIDGVKVSAVDMAELGFPSFSGGSIGFRTGNAESGWVDDLKVTNCDGIVLYQNDFSTACSDFGNASVSEDGHLSIPRKGRAYYQVADNVFVSSGWYNYDFECDFAISSGALGFSFYVDETSDSRYMWQVRGDKNQLRLHVYKNGKVIGGVTDIDLGTKGIDVKADGKTHKIKISVRGANIDTYIDGILANSGTRDVYTLTYGSIGFRTGAKEAGWVDNVKVTTEYGAPIYSDDFSSGINNFFPAVVNGSRLNINNGTSEANYVVRDQIPVVNVFFARKDFEIPASKTVDSAILSVTALKSSKVPYDRESAHQWTYKAYVNGNFVGMGPHMDSIDDKYFYNNFDVTDLVVNGGNTVGAIVYAMKDQRLQAQLKITYTDGSSEIIATDETWKTLDGTDAYGEGEGTICFERYIAMTENIDAREFPYGWDTYGYNDSEWYAPYIKEQIVDIVPSRVDPMYENEVEIAKVVDKGDGNYFIDLGKEIIGGLRLVLDEDGVEGKKITVLYGEELSAENTVRWKLRTANQYREYWTLKNGKQTFEHFGMKAFRYVELKNVPAAITAKDIEAGLKGVAIHMAFDESESYFVSDNQILNDIYELCKYTLKVTTQDVYVDSQTRERNCFEGDAYINQLSHYSFTRNYTVSRFTNEFLSEHPNGCTEYSQESIMSFWEDYLYTGNTVSIESHYEALCNALLDELYDETYRMVNTNGKDDLVDWPTSLLDGFLVEGNNDYNIVVNALVYRAAMDLASIADVLGNDADVKKYTSFAQSVKDGIMELYDEELGRFYEGRGADGSILTEEDPSQHASFFPLTLGVVTDQEKIDSISEFLESEGIECSVYGAQFLLTAMYAAGNEQAALDMMLSTEMESWYHMIYELNATVTAESWDPSYKSNMTFSHAWGSAPGNIIVRNLCGITPLEAGYGKAQIKPAIGNLKNLSVKVPNIKGYIYMDLNTANSAYITDMTVTLPTNTTAKVYVPAGSYTGTELTVDGVRVNAIREGNYLVIDNVGSGKHTFQIAFENYVFDAFSGRYISEKTGKYCEHISFTNGTCDLCGFVCVHDWQYEDTTATCTVCSMACASDEITEYDSTCAMCGDNSTYIGGACTKCGTECAHIFNAGGHCVFCGEFGNAITFADGQNGGGNLSGATNGKALTIGDTAYVHSDDTQLWDYRDAEGMLLGRDYVFSGKFTFNEYTYNSSNEDGATRLLIWSEGDVNYSNTKFALYLFGNNGKLELSPYENDADKRIELVLNKEYDIRVAVHSKKSAYDTYTNVADIIINGKLVWTRSFTLTSANGMAIRIGDHTTRQTLVKYNIAKDFGIHCLDSNINFIGTQEKEDANYKWDPTYDLRFVFGIDNIYLDDVGVKVEAEMVGSTLYEDASGELTCSSSKTVLNSIMAGGKVCTPGAYGAGYGGNYIALAITDIPLDPVATYTFTLTPYVTYHGGETVFSETSHKITVSFNDYQMNIGCEK